MNFAQACALWADEEIGQVPYVAALARELGRGPWAAPLPEKMSQAQISARGMEQQLKILAALWGRRRPMTAPELREHSGAGECGVYYSANALVERGLAAVKPGRPRRYVLTDRGRDVAREEFRLAVNTVKARRR